jgi:hypothetical protein
VSSDPKENTQEKTTLEDEAIKLVDLPFCAEYEVDTIDGKFRKWVLENCDTDRFSPSVEAVEVPF